MSLEFKYISWNIIILIKRGKYTCPDLKEVKIKRLYFLRRKNIIGNKLGVLIPPNTFGKGLQIMHHGSIIVNPDVRVGDYCVLHGNNCIGNNEKK